MQIEIQRVPEAQRRSIPSSLDFGATFSDHMFCQNYSADKGWHDARIMPYQPLSLDPSAAVLHYSQEIFEGLKAYRAADGSVKLFRPMENCLRFNRSAKRMVMPEVDAQFHLDAIKALVNIDSSWVPADPGTSLYLRPAMIATGKKLGLGASGDYMHFIIASPSGSYFKGGFHPISVHIADSYRRAVKGGVGEAKTGGNYAASLYASEEVAKSGYSQVLWLDAQEGRYIEEVGAMNICFVYEGKRIVTPALSGSILPGITRNSILKLAPTLGYEAEEKRLDVDQVMADIESGKITECFGCGTAAVISPVGVLSYKGIDHQVHNNTAGPVSKHLYDQLTGIQYGQVEDPFGWVESV
jgi:branched-chain amino acid aminotransferase